MQGLFNVSKQSGSVLVRFKAGCEVTPDLVISAMDRENELYEIIGRSDIWDFRGCHPSPDFGYDAMLGVLHHIETHYNDQWSTKTAILVDKAIQFGLSRMFQMLSDGYPTQIGIFLDETKALNWINKKGTDHDHHSPHR